METSLTVKKENLLALMPDGGMAELIKPLQNEILLLETYVAGTAYIEDESVFDEAHDGDKLILRREDNRFDEKAILVLDQKERKLGYVPDLPPTFMSGEPAGFEASEKSALRISTAVAGEYGFIPPDGCRKAPDSENRPAFS